MRNVLATAKVCQVIVEVVGVVILPAVAGVGLWAGAVRGPLAAVQFKLKIPAGGAKVENGRLISWQIVSESPRDAQIELFDQSGGQPLSLSPFQSFPGIKAISISDVSVAPSGTIAVAAVAVAADAAPASCLLVYSGAGQLLHAFRLPAEREPMRLELDENDRIWALGVGAGFKDPGDVPMVFAYDTDGNVVHEFLRRAQFAKDAQLTREGPFDGGAVSFGLAGDRVWFFLPASRQLVTLKRDGSDTQIVDTGLPSPLPSVNPVGLIHAQCRNASLLPSGRFLIQMNFTTESSVRNDLYEWDAGKRVWKALRLGDAVSGRELFLGGDDTALSLATFNGLSAEVKAVAVPAP